MERARPSGVIAPLAALAPLAGLALGLGGVSPSAAEAAPSFTLIGSVPSSTGSISSRIYGLSADGRSAAGYSSTGRNPGFLWTVDGGRNDFGLSSEFTGSSEGLGISGDGRVVVGTHFTSLTNTQPYRWTQSGGLQDLGLLPGYNWGIATDASHDGSVVVGYFDNGGTRAFRWTQAGGMQTLGGGMRANAISGNGNVIVGSTGPSNNRPVMWTQDAGIQFLPTLDGTSGGAAGGINHDGSVIVGVSGEDFRGTMWVGDTVIDLTAGSNSMNFSATNLSDDGTVVIGQLNLGSGGLFAGVWTHETGMMKLSDYLLGNGVVIPENIGLGTVTGVSYDGKTFAGYTANGPFGIQGWVATVPAPGFLSCAGIAGLWAARRRRV